MTEQNLRLEVCRAILFNGGKCTLPPGRTFSSVQAMVEATEQLARKAGPRQRSKLVGNIPILTNDEPAGLSKTDIEQLMTMRNPAVRVVKSTSDGRILKHDFRELSDLPEGITQLATAPPVLGNTTGDPDRDDDLKLAIHPNVDKRWGFNPKNLAGKSLDQLNAMIEERDPSLFIDGPFDTKDEAIAQLSEEFDPSLIGNE